MAINKMNDGDHREEKVHCTIFLMLFSSYGLICVETLKSFHNGTVNGHGCLVNGK